MPDIRFFVWAGISLFGLGFLLPLAAAWLLRLNTLRATALSLLLAMAGNLVVLGCAVAALIRQKTFSFSLIAANEIMPALPKLTFTIYVDSLAAFFLLLIGGLSLGVTIYSFDYLREKTDRLPIATVYNLFVLSGILFVIANDIFFQVLFLESVTLSFAFLILHKHNESPGRYEPKQAVKTYLIANHIGGILVAAALLTLAFSYQNPSFDFSIFRNRAIQPAHSLQNLIFWLTFIGFGIKAGLVPFHIWVSIAHPSSPTNTHAMSLGIMIKIAIYGMIRVFFEFLHPIAWWWGLVVLVIAALTAIVGVGNAIRGRTLKDSLADHSVENIGIILAGVGLALIFASEEFAENDAARGLAGLALAAGLYHLLNHTVFKGLLYLSTGAIDYLTGGIVDLERLGGLIHRFPWTSSVFLVGSVAIAGFPPLNGFISEWLTLQALFAGMTVAAASQSLWLFLGIVFSILLLAGAFAMTALAFVKIAGETLLGAPRDESVLRREKKNDVPWRMRGVMLVLAAMCLLLGLFPGAVIAFLGLVTADLGFPLPAANKAFSFNGIAVETAANYAAHLPPAFLFILTALFGIIIFLAIRTRQGESQNAEEAPPPWTFAAPYAPQMQYTSSAYTALVRDAVSSLMTVLSSLTVSRQLEKKMAGMLNSPLESRIEISPGRFAVERFRQVYNVIINILARFSQRVGSFIQNGDLRNYLLYIFLIFIVVLLFLVGGEV